MQIRKYENPYILKITYFTKASKIHIVLSPTRPMLPSNGYFTIGYLKKDEGWVTNLLNESGHPLTCMIIPPKIQNNNQYKIMQYHTMKAIKIQLKQRSIIILTILHLSTHELNS